VSSGSRNSPQYYIREIGEREILLGDSGTDRMGRFSTISCELKVAISFHLPPFSLDSVLDTNIST
jgi:hypothetical protein